MPQTVYDVGDPITSRLKLGVVPDGTTVATVVVRRPDNTVITGLVPSAWEGASGDEKTIQWYATDDGAVGTAGTAGVADGDWLVVWSIQGKGASVTAKVYPVRPLPGTATRPRWVPFLSEVADFVPWLTLDTATPGGQLYLGTFTGNTTPSDEQAQRHIDRITRPITERWPDLSTDLYESARSYVALRAAARLARAFPRFSADLSDATDLAREADASWALLVDAADATTVSPTADGHVPIYAFPDPPVWGDLTI